MYYEISLIQVIYCYKHVQFKNRFYVKSAYNLTSSIKYICSCKF